MLGSGCWWCWWLMGADWSGVLLGDDGCWVILFGEKQCVEASPIRSVLPFSCFTDISFWIAKFGSGPNTFNRSFRGHSWNKYSFLSACNIINPQGQGEYQYFKLGPWGCIFIKRVCWQILVLLLSITHSRKASKTVCCVAHHHYNNLTRTACCLARTRLSYQLSLSSKELSKLTWYTKDK